MACISNKISIAFDIDGTVFDSGDILLEGFTRGIDVFTESASRHGLKRPSKDELLSVVGIPAENIFRDFFPELNDEEREKLAESCTASLAALIRAREGKIYEGADVIIKTLHSEGHLLFAASNGRETYIKAILETYGIIGCFHSPLIFTGKMLPDKTAMIKYFIENFTSGRGLIMIGDRFSDFNAARDNGIPFIGCAYGHAGDTEIREAKWIARTFSDIPGLIYKIQKK